MADSDSSGRFFNREVEKSIRTRKCRCNKIANIFHLTLYRILPVGFLVFFLYQRFSVLYEGQTCLIAQFAVPEFAMKLGDCNICQNVSESIVIEEISPTQFMEKYAYASRPLLMKKAASDWPALNVFTFEYFKNLYAKNPKSLENDASGGQFFSYSSGIEDINELMMILGSDASQHSKWYIGWSTADPIIGKEMRKYIPDPYFLPPDTSDNSLAWIFMGSPGPGASLHVDWVERTSWQAQISGVKTWTLVPPPECEHVCGGGFNVSVETGDIIVVDTNFWYHSTYIHPGEVSITYGTEFE